MTPRLVRTRLALGPFVPTLRRLTRAPSIKRKSVSARRSGCEAPAALTEIRQALALTHLEFFDHAKTGVTLLRQFDRGVGEIAAAFVPGDKDCDLVHETVKLTSRISGVLGLDFGPDFVRLSPFVVQIFENKFVFRIEVAVKRHLAGARSLSDCFDADPSDTPTVEEVLRAVKDSVAGLPGPGNLYLRIRTRFFFVHGA